MDGLLQEGRYPSLSQSLTHDSLGRLLEDAAEGAVGATSPRPAAEEPGETWSLAGVKVGPIFIHISAPLLSHPHFWGAYARPAISCECLLRHASPTPTPCACLPYTCCTWLPSYASLHMPPRHKSPCTCLTNVLCDEGGRPCIGWWCSRSRY